VKELEKLNVELSAAMKVREQLVQTPVAQPVSDAQREQLALQVPAELEQSRFLRLLREAEKSSGAALKSITFQTGADAEDGEVQGGGEAKKLDGGEAAGPLQEQKGKLSLEGKYAQVRQFLDKFANMQRLVTFDKWNLEAKEQVDASISLTTRPSSAPVAVQMPGTGRTSTPAAGSPNGDGSGNRDAAGTSGSGTGKIDPSQVSPETAKLLEDPLLKDRSPIYTQEQFDRLAESINAKLVYMTTQRDKDIANLQIQQAYNRLQAGLKDEKEAASLFEMDTAQIFVTGANPNVRAVLGLPARAPAPAAPPDSPTPAPTTGASPITFLYQPVMLGVEARREVKNTIVKLDIDFTIYFAPSAGKLLPPLSEFDLYKPVYDPTNRTNPVESQ